MGQRTLIWGCALALSCCTAGAIGAQESNDPFTSANEPNQDASPRQEPKPATGETSPVHSPSAALQRIEAALDQPLRAPLEAVAQPLNSVLAMISQDYDLPIVFDTHALDAVAASPDVEVNLNVANVSLRSALELLLKSAGTEDLTYVVDNEVLLITTQEAAQQRLEVKIFRVDDLVSRDGAQLLYENRQLDSLIDLIVATIEKDSWAQNGTGEGEIHPFMPAMLVVSQTHRVQQQIQRVLDELRETKAAILASRPADEGAHQRPVTRSFPLRAGAVDSPHEMQTLRQALQQSVDWSPAAAGLSEEKVFLHVFASQVLVRHTPRVVQQIESVIGEISPPLAVGGRQGGRSRAAEGGGF